MDELGNVVEFILIIIIFTMTKRLHDRSLDSILSWSSLAFFKSRLDSA